MGAGRGEDQGRDHREREQAARAPARQVAVGPAGRRAAQTACSTTPVCRGDGSPGRPDNLTQLLGHRAFHGAGEVLDDESPAVALIDNDDFKDDHGLTVGHEASRRSANGKDQPQLATA
jgi:hypothetical protein